MTDRDEIWTSCHSFSVGFGDMLAGLPDDHFGRVLKAITDPTPGLRTMLVLDRRDEAVRELAGLYTGSVSAKAKAIEHDLSGYLSTAWRREREREGPAPGASSKRRLLYRIACSNDGGNLGARQLMRIIGGQRGGEG